MSCLDGLNKTHHPSYHAAAPPPDMDFSCSLAHWPCCIRLHTKKLALSRFYCHEIRGLCFDIKAKWWGLNQPRERELVLSHCCRYRWKKRKTFVTKLHQSHRKYSMWHGDKKTRLKIHHQTTKKSANQMQGKSPKAFFFNSYEYFVVAFSFNH